MAALAADRACTILADDLTMAALAAAGDTSYPDGSVNVPGVVEALERLCEARNGLPGHAELSHLIQHINFTLKRLHFLV